MGLVVCTTALNNGGFRAEVGQVYEDSNVMVIKHPSFFADPTDFQATGATNLKWPVPDTSADVYATPRVLTTAQSGSVIVCSAAAGQDITLPAIAAADVGTFFDFVLTATITSNNWRITAASGDFLNGAVWIADFDTANTGAYFAANGSSHLVMTMNGGTKGGKAGSWVRFTAISATGWFVYGNLFGDGALATPFS